MTLQYDFRLSRGFEEARYEIERRFFDISQAINGVFRSYTPKIYGSTATGTYTAGNSNSSNYYLQGFLVDVFLKLEWTLHTGTGNLRIELPFIVQNANDTPFVGSLVTSGLNWGASNTQVNLVARPNTNYLEIVASQNNASSSIVPIDANATIQGHIRYIIKPDTLGN